MWAESSVPELEPIDDSLKQKHKVTRTPPGSASLPMAATSSSTSAMSSISTTTTAAENATEEMSETRVEVHTGYSLSPVPLANDFMADSGMFQFVEPFDPMSVPMSSTGTTTRSGITAKSPRKRSSAIATASKKKKQQSPSKWRKKKSSSSSRKRALSQVHFDDGSEHDTSASASMSSSVGAGRSRAHKRVAAASTNRRNNHKKSSSLKRRTSVSYNPADESDYDFAQESTEAIAPPKPFKRRRSQRLQQSSLSLIPMDAKSLAEASAKCKVWTPGFQTLGVDEIYGVNEVAAVIVPESEKKTAVALTRRRSNSTTPMSSSSITSTSAKTMASATSKTKLTTATSAGTTAPMANMTMKPKACRFCSRFREENLSDETFDARHFRAERRETLVYDQLLKKRKDEEMTRIKTQKVKKQMQKRGSLASASASSLPPKGGSPDTASSSKCGSVSGVGGDGSTLLPALKVKTRVSLLNYKLDDAAISGRTAVSQSSVSSSTCATATASGSGEKKQKEHVAAYVPKKYRRPEFNYPIGFDKIRRGDALFRRHIFNAVCECGRRQRPLSSSEAQELAALEGEDWFKVYSYNVRRTDIVTYELLKDPSVLNALNLKTSERKKMIILVDTMRRHKAGKPVDARHLAMCREMIKDMAKKKKDRTKK